MHKQSGYGVTTLPGVPQAEAVCMSKPAAILFTSIESLGGGANADYRIGATAISLSWSVHLLLMSRRARELGADHCLLHL